MSLRLPALAAMLPLAAASCALLAPAPPVAPAYYVLEPAPPPPGPPSGRTVSVLPFTAGPCASGQLLLYRTGEERFERDYYNRFLAPPSRMLTGALRRALARARAGRILEPAGPLEAGLVVQPHLTELHADYRNPDRPRAVAAMVVVVAGRPGPDRRLVLDRTYRREVPMGHTGPGEAVRAMERAMASVFAEFAADLRRAE